MEFVMDVKRDVPVNHVVATQTPRMAFGLVLHVIVVLIGTSRHPQDVILQHVFSYKITLIKQQINGISRKM